VTEDTGVGSAAQGRLRGPVERNRRRAEARIDRFGIVLILIATTIVVPFIAGDGPLGGTISFVLSAVTLWFVLAASDVRPGLTLAVRILVIGAIVLALVGLVAGEGSQLASLTPVVQAGLVLIGPVVIARRLVRQPVVSGHTIAGALCLYLLAGLFFAYAFQGIQTVGGQAFNQTTDASQADFIYFSFITLGTLGYGDFTPATNLGKLLAVVEAVSGQLYLVTVVAVLVTNLGRVRRGGRPVAIADLAGGTAPVGPDDEPPGR
jgi:hypothetical protein